MVLMAVPAQTLAFKRKQKNNTLPDLKMDGWNTNLFPFEAFRPVFFAICYSFREGIPAFKQLFGSQVCTP